MTIPTPPDPFRALKRAGLLAWTTDATLTVRGYAGPPGLLGEGDDLRARLGEEAAEAHRRALRGRDAECRALLDGRPYRLRVHPLPDAPGPAAVTDAYPERTPDAPADRVRAALERARALYEITQDLAHARSGPDLLARIVEQPGRVLGANRTILITLDDEQTRVEHYLRAGEGAEHALVVPLAELREGLTGWVLRHRRKAVSPSHAPDPRESALVARRRAETHCGGIVVLPVQTDERIFGTLTVVAAPHEPDFAEDEIAWLEALANVGATALEQRRLHDRLAFLAQHDHLTGLPNRLLWDDRLRQAALRAERYGERFALLLIDLDGFKAVNDARGHAAGDRLLVEIARRLSEGVRASDTVARTGGDEFCVLALHVTGPEDALVVAGKLLARLRDPVHVDDAGPEVRVDASIGVAVHGLHGHDGNALLARADEAMYRAKRAGRGGARLAENG